ncbi:hypothetical protein FNU76_09750 [Chitinimonas arctica]|uniref:DUF4194 domain-containing protein n=1 Tax=Chitinimonas arctica TaxID=2594795 RepID=A0A516SEN2_9NEIS|nr:hypothetical protein [Chitinimonas arctica]QDQ26624.1 hypothetical protein FNU76_09750 [Chitinimonas arctica]
MDNALAILSARLIAHRFIPRSDPLARRALVDEDFRRALEHRLNEVGLTLLENPYAEHMAVGLMGEMEAFVFGEGEAWLSNNMNLPRDAIALLVVLWALIILPKRERQVARAEKEREGQSDMFGAEKPLVQGEEVSVGVPEEALYADYRDKLGGKGRLNINLGQLARLGFIERRNKVILEGPLLDLMLDYSTLAPRVIEGALGEVLKRRAEEAVQPTPD